MGGPEVPLGLSRAASPVVVTKLAPDALPEDHIPRSRLVRTLDATRPLTVVVAAPGSGKTILLTEWAAGLGPISRWLSLDDDDNDPDCFWEHVLASLAIAPQGADWAHGAAGPVAALARRSDRSPVVLVVDQVHVLVRPDARHALHLLVQHAPRWLRLVLACRARPEIPLHLHRTRDRLQEVDGAALAFTRAEVAALAHATGRPLDDGAVVELEERTEGWAVGVRLGLSGLLGAPDVHGFLTGFDGTAPHVTEYLRREVLDAQPRSVRRLLEDVAPFERFDAGLCAAVTGRAGVPALLRELVDAHVLVLECSEPRAYRVHRMLRELLQADLRSDHPGRTEDLHARAAAWLEGTGDSLAAAEEWTQAGRRDEAARVIDDRLPELYATGRLDVLRPWTGVGAPASGGTPWALMDLASRLLLGSEDEAGREVLDQVDALLEHATDRVSELRATCIHGVYDLMQGDLQRATQHLDDVWQRVRACPDLEDDPRVTSRGVVRHADLWAAVGLAWLDEYEEARCAIARSVRPGGGRGRAERALPCGCAVVRGGRRGPPRRRREVGSPHVRRDGRNR